MSRSRLLKRTDSNSVSVVGVLSGFGGVCAVATTLIVANAVHSSSEPAESQVVASDARPSVATATTAPAHRVKLSEGERTRQKALSALVSETELADPGGQREPTLTAPTPASSLPSAVATKADKPVRPAAANPPSLAKPHAAATSATNPINAPGKAKGWAQEKKHAKPQGVIQGVVNGLVEGLVKSPLAATKHAEHSTHAQHLKHSQPSVKSTAHPTKQAAVKQLHKPGKVGRHRGR